MQKMFKFYPRLFVKIIGVFLLFTTFLFYGCRVQKEEVAPNRSNGNLLEKVREHYFKRKGQNKSTLEEKNQDYPQFEKGIIRTLPNQQTIISYPVYNKESYVYSERIGYVKRYVVRLDARDSVIETKTFEMIGNKEFLKTEKDNIPAQYYAGNMPTQKFIILISNKENPSDTTKLNYNNVISSSERCPAQGMSMDFIACILTITYICENGRTTVRQTPLINVAAGCDGGGGGGSGGGHSGGTGPSGSNPPPSDGSTNPWNGTGGGGGGGPAGDIRRQDEDCTQPPKLPLDNHRVFCEDAPLNGCNGTLNDNTGGGCEEETDANIPNDLDPKLKAIVDDKFKPKSGSTQKAMTDDEWKIIDRDFKKMHEKSCLFRVMIKYFTDKGLKIQMGADPNMEAGAMAVNGSKIIFGKNSFNGSTRGTENLTHELFHIFQKNIGESMYEPPVVSGQGKINVEFEAYFFTDFINKFYLPTQQNKSPFGYADFTFNQKTNQPFNDWINSTEMSNNKTTYPTNINQTKWDQFMSEFKSGDVGQSYPTSTIITGKPPKAFLKMIELANKPNSGCNPNNGTH